MAYTSPLRNLTKKKSTKKDEEEKYINKYDDGGIWSKPDTSETYEYLSPLRNLASGDGFKSGVTIQKATDEQDPLQSARNQVQYYTNKLNEAGIEEQKPSLWKRMKSSGGDLVIDLLTRVGAVSGAGSNALSGTLNSTFENTDAIVKAAKGKDLTDEQVERLKNNAGLDPGTRMANDLMAGAKSGLSTLGGLFTGEYSKKNVDFGVMLENMRDNDEILSKTAGSLVELPGKAIAKGFGASDEVANNIGNMVGDLGLSILTGGITDVDDAGKALKYIKNTKAIDAKEAVTSLSKATKLADDTLKFTDYVETLGDKASKYSDDILQGMFKKAKEDYALDLVKEANKAIGGMSDFKGLTMGKKTVVSKETLKKISENKAQKKLTEVGLSLLSPVSALTDNTITRKIGEKVLGTEVGQAVSDTFSRSFIGGKKSDWVLSAKKNPEKALEYMNQAKAKELQKKVSDMRIQKTMDKINKYSDIKETPEQITKIIEKPETIEKVVKEVETEINNPQYVKKMMDLSNEAYKENIDEINKLKSYINVQKAELDLNKENMSNYETVKGALDKKIEVLEKRKEVIETSKRAKSIDFNKQVEKFGFKGDYQEHFDDALNMSLEDLTKKLGDEDLAYALNESANRVLDVVDEKVPGLSKYYSQSGTVTTRYSTSMNYELPDEVYKKINEAPGFLDRIDVIEEALADSLDRHAGRDEVKFLQTKKDMTVRSHIRKIIKDNGITGVDKEYEYFLDSIGGEELMKQHKFFKGKEDYANTLREKVKNSKVVREFLGDDSDNLIHDMHKILDKRIAGEDSLELALSKTARNNTKMDRLNNLRIKKTTGEAIVHQNDIDKLEGVANALRFNDPNNKFIPTYSSKKVIPKEMPETRKAFDNVFRKGLGYAEGKKDVTGVARLFLKESGIEKGFKTVKEVSQGLYEANDLEEALSYLGRVSSEYKAHLVEQYKVKAMYMTDDEIRMVLDQNSTFRNIPDYVKKSMKEYQEPKADFDDMKKAKKSAFNNMESLKTKVEDYSNATMNKTEYGVSRDKWLDEEEAGRFKESFNKGLYAGGSEKHIDNYMDNMSEEQSKNYEKIRAIKEKRAKFRVDEKSIPDMVTSEQLIGKQTPLKKIAKKDDGINSIVEDLKGRHTNDKETMSEVAMGYVTEDDFKDVVKERFGEVKTTGMKFDTPTGTVLIDRKMKLRDFDKVINPDKYDGSKVGSKIIYTTEVIDKEMPTVVAKYLPDQNTIIVNMNLDKRKTLSIIEHEFGHKITNKITEGNSEVLLEEARNILTGIKGLEDVDKKKLMELSEYAITGNGGAKGFTEQGLFTNYLAKLSKKGASKETLGNEFLAEVLALYNNPNTRISNKFKKLSPELTKSVEEYVAKLTPGEVKEVIPRVRNRYGDDVAQELVGLKMEKEAMTQVATTLDDIIDKNIKKVSETIESLEEATDELGKAMDSFHYNENGEVINKEYDKLYSTVEKTYGKEFVEKNTKGIEKYKKITQLEEEVFRIDHTKDLSDEALELIEDFKEEMKQIALVDGIYKKEEEAEAFVTYIAHQINPKYSDQAEIIEKGRKLEAELRETFNKNKLTRKLEGTIDEINTKYENQIGVRLFEENINRLWLKRRINSEKFIQEEAEKQTLLKSFAIPIISSVDEEFKKNTKLIDEMLDEDFLKNIGIGKEEFVEKYITKGEDTIHNTLKKEFNYENIKKNNPEYFKKLYSEEVTKFKNEFNSIPNEKQGNNLVKKRLRDVSSKFSEEAYYEKLSKELGFEPVLVRPLDRVPLKTDDGRDYVEVRTKDERVSKRAEGNMPYMVEDRIKGQDDLGRSFEEDPTYYSYKQGYQDFVYKKAKEKGYIMVDTIESNKKNLVTKRVVSDQAVERAIGNKSSVIDEIKKIANEDIDVIDDFTALNDSSVIKVSDLKQEEFIENLKNNKMLIDKEAWNNYQKELRDAEFKQKAPILKAYEAVSRLFSSQALFSVGFHNRNAVQNAVASYVKAGVNLLSPKKNKEALDIMMYMAGKKDFTKEIGGYNIDALLRELEVNGIFETEVKNLFDTDVTKKFLAGETDKLRTTSNNPLNKLSKGYQSSAKTTIGKAWDKTSGVNFMSSDFIGYKGSAWVGDKIETQAKLINILSHLDSGMNLTDAIHMTKETLFDYSDLTKFEKNVMKRAMPFYTFMRKNLPSQIDNMKNHTGRMTRITNLVPKSYNKDTEQERALRPEYLDGQISLGNGKFLGLGDATRDLQKLYNPLEALSSLNPLVKTPIELAFNTQLYSGQDISKFDKMSEKVQYAIEGNLPILKQLSAVANANSDDEEKRRKAQNTLKKFAGNLVSEFDMDKQEKATMYDYVELLQNQYYEALEKNPKLFETEGVKKNTSKYESPITKLRNKKR